MAMSAVRHINIPIFIPHEGCPNDCVFCNQHSITSRNAHTLSRADRDIRPEIDTALSTIHRTEGNTEVEIAFFGGSFTGIDRNVMIRLLKDAHSYIVRGDVSSIRLSTRPDFIDSEILCILSQYGVRHIELGIQSMNNDVLSASHRGHTAEQTEYACKLITNAGFSLTGQMMVGLPCSTPDDEVATALKICRMGADSARIYPTVVFYDTMLCEMAKRGKYTPLTDDEGAYRAALCMQVFEQHDVKLLRVGLQSGEGLSSEKVYAGASHSAIGEMASGELYFMKIKALLQNIAPTLDKGTRYELDILCPYGQASQACGHKKRNRKRILDLCRDMGIDIGEIKIKSSSDISSVGIDFKNVADIVKDKKKTKKLHITNGDFFNTHFEKVTGFKGIPFNEAMMTGKACEEVFSQEFDSLRANSHSVTREEYTAKLSPMHRAVEKLKDYDEVHLYFGKDAFCICNMLTVLALLEQKNYGKKVFVTYIDDEDFSDFTHEYAEKNKKEIPLGIYNEIYKSVLVNNAPCECPDPDISHGIKLYFDFHSPDGKLASMVKQSPHKSETELLTELLEHSAEYGMSDIQGKELIKKIRG